MKLCLGLCRDIKDQVYIDYDFIIFVFLSIKIIISILLSIA